ncbi:lactonase family protein [Algoriphagus sediminis]|uniref:Lactonase family protein n=1 Tax=Algoriphagus sediminis TaxID=3057113 RepID=A0ABT7YE56_9BACT|nr:lactonase family protein [Algoriphagus sediminis]MDN3204805.1 lactonase family protein [Algoriphagus sediminis]
MEKEESPNYTFLVGTYPENPSQGICKLYFSPGSNILEVSLLKDSISNPSFILANKANNRAFSVEEVASEQGGNVVMFEMGTSFQTLSSDPTFGDHPCYLALSPDEKWLVVGNYSGGNFSLFSISPDSLTHIQTVSHSGESVNKARQESAHVHSTVFSPDGSYLMVMDLGTDKVYQYQFDPLNDSPLSLTQEIEMTPGDGPRHGVFSPSGNEFAILQELSGFVNIYSFDDGKMVLRQRESIVDENFTGEHGAAEIRYSPDGQNIYTSNRGDDNSIAVFRRDSNGNFKRIQIVESGGIKPRNFIVTSDGKYLLSAHETSNDIVVFERNPESGELLQTDLKTEVNSPVYLFEISGN